MSQFLASLLRGLALATIEFYQRHLSPHKGFSCAYRVHTGRASCSVLGHRAIRWHGLFTGLGLVRERLARCGEVYRRFHPLAHGAPLRQRRGQAGDCDCVAIDCGTLDGCDCSDAMRVGDACNCGDCNREQRKPQPARRRERRNQRDPAVADHGSARQERRQRWP